MRQNLEELGITTYQLNDKDMRVTKLEETMKKIQVLDDAWRGNKQYGKGEDKITLTLETYVIMRCSFITVLAHIVAVPNGRGGDRSDYVEKVIMFNQQVGEFQLWQDSGICSILLLNWLLVESLSIVGYSWMEKDITVQKILVYINPLGMHGRGIGNKQLEELQADIE